MAPNERLHHRFAPVYGETVVVPRNSRDNSLMTYRFMAGFRSSHYGRSCPSANHGRGQTALATANRPIRPGCKLEKKCDHFIAPLTQRYLSETLAPIKQERPQQDM